MIDMLILIQVRREFLNRRVQICRIAMQASVPHDFKLFVGITSRGWLLLSIGDMYPASPGPATSTSGSRPSYVTFCDKRA